MLSRLFVYMATRACIYSNMDCMYSSAIPAVLFPASHQKLLTF